MIDLRYDESPLHERAARAAGVRLPNARLTAPDGSAVRLYDLLPIGHTPIVSAKA
jgi:hypothetical protein